MLERKLENADAGAAVIGGGVLTSTNRTPGGFDNSPTGDGVTRSSATVENERFVADLKRFVADLEALMGQAKSLTGEGAIVARSQLENKIGEVRRGFGYARAAATDRARMVRGRAEQYMRDDPWKAVAIAAATGGVAALILNRR